MILCDHEIDAAIESGEIRIEPKPLKSQIASTAIDLRVGDDFRRWKRALWTPGLSPVIDLETIRIADLLELTEPIEPVGACVDIRPNDFVLVRTLEWVHLPIASRLAGRVEGRSTPARFGLSVHVTAPTIHGGFNGKITLEILNHGPFVIRVRPSTTCICQLILERVSAVPRGAIATAFMEQSTPLGTPRPAERRDYPSA